MEGSLLLLSLSLVLLIGLIGFCLWIGRRFRFSIRHGDFEIEFSLGKD